MAPTTWIQYVGEEEYHGSDGNPFAGGRAVDLRAGQAAEVSAEKAAQVLRDFPNWFVALDGPPAATKPEPEDPRERLLAMTRKELNAIAAELKIAEAEKLPNKDAVAEAILAASAPPAEGESDAGGDDEQPDDES